MALGALKAPSSAPAGAYGLFTPQAPETGIFIFLKPILPPRRSKTPIGACKRLSNDKNRWETAVKTPGRLQAFL